MLEELKKQSIKKGMKSAVIWIIFGIIVFALGFKDLQDIRTGLVKYDELGPEDLSEDICIEMSLTENYGSYMEEYEQKVASNERKTTKVCYLLGIGEPADEDFRLVSMVVPASYEDQMEKMAENTFNGISSTAIDFTCEVAKMGSEERSFAQFYLQQMGYNDSEIDEILLPYHIVYCDWEAKTRFVYILCGGGAVIVAFGILMMLYTFSGMRLRKIKKEIAESGYSWDQVEGDYAGAKILVDKPLFRMGRFFTFCYVNATPHIILNKDIVWGYYFKVVEKGRRGLLKKTTHMVVLKTRNKKAFAAEVPGEGKAHYILDLMNKVLPWMVIGSSDALHKMYDKDLQGFLNLRYNQIDDKTTKLIP